MQQTIVCCSNCGKPLKKGEKEDCEKNDIHECAECQFHAISGTRTIQKYNDWLKKG